MVSETRERVLAALRKCSIFQQVGPDVLTDALTVSQLRQVRDKEVICRKGEGGEQVFIVVSGYLRVLVHDPSGKRNILNLMGPGEMFGEVAILDGSQRSANVEACEDGEILVIDRATFMGLLHRHSTVAVALATFLGGRLRQLSLQMESRVFRDTSARIAHQLVSLCDRFGEHQKDGSVSLPIHLSQRELGELIDSTRESVNRQLRQLVQAGLICTEGESLVVIDVDALRRRSEL